MKRASLSLRLSPRGGSTLFSFLPNFRNRLSAASIGHMPPVKEMAQAGGEKEEDPEKKKKKEEKAREKELKN